MNDTRPLPKRYARFHHRPVAPPPSPDRYTDEAHRALVLAIDSIGVSRKDLARHLRVTAPFLSQLIAGRRRIPPGLCEDLWRLSDVEPTRVRPDLHWVQDDRGHWYWRDPSARGGR